MWIRGDKDGTVLVCRLHPNARKDSIEGVRDDQLLIHLNAPPVEGKANKALQKFLSDRLDIPKSRISLRSGDKSRTKVLFLSGISPDDVQKRIGL